MTLLEMTQACNAHAAGMTANKQGNSHIELSRKGREVILEKLSGGKWGVSASTASRELVGGPEETYASDEAALARCVEILTNGEA